MGILNSPEYQIVYSDTPGMLKPQYELHKSMMRFVHDALEDADVVLFITDVFEKYTEEDEEVKLLQRTEAPVIILINKIDVAKEGQLEAAEAFWKNQQVAEVVLPISAQEGLNVGKAFDEILSRIPQHPPFFPKDALTDKPERFFAAEMIREKIFLNYKKEVPYSTEVVIEEFKETDDIIRIRAEIFVERQTQKGILIGKNGEMLKRVGIQARTDLETFFQKQVHLETFVKVAQDWRKKSQNLNRFGYNPK
jgi:GTP-binding protein Era